MDWKAGQFTTSTFVGEGKKPMPVNVAGWISERWALDFRAFEDESNEWVQGGWAMTHIQTGQKAFNIIGVSVSQAQDIVEVVDAMADWNFTDPQKGRSLREVARKAMDHFPDILTRGGAACSPEKLEFIALAWI